jgi:hypothetical protein
MTLKVEIAATKAASSWTDITSLVERTSFRLGGRAFNGESASCGFDLDDDAASRNLPPHRVVRVTEDATASPTILMWGRVESDSSSRGTRFSDDARKYDVSLSDRNADVRGIVVRAWSRPAETAAARLQALVADYLDGSWRASTNLTDTLVTTGSPMTASMPKKRYHGVAAVDIIDEIQQASGCLWFVTADGRVFARAETSTAYASTISITDDGTDDQASVFAPIFEGEAGTREKSEVLSGGVAGYGSSGLATERRTSIEDAGDRWEDVLSTNATTSSGAATELAQQLDLRQLEDATYRCAIDLRADQVDLIAYGQMVTFRAAAARVTTPATVRVAELTWENVGKDLYRAHLELARPTKIASRIKRGTGGSGGTIATADGTPVGLAPFDANDYLAFDGAHFYAWTCSGVGDNGGVASSSVDLTMGTYDYSMTMIADGGIWAGRGGLSSDPDPDYGWNTGSNPLTIDVGSSFPVTVSGSIVLSLDAPDIFGHGNAASLLHVPGRHWTLSGWIDPVGWVPPDPPLPTAGQEVANDVPTAAPDGATALFTLTVASAGAGYRPQTLRIFVAGIDITADITETDPAAGTFTSSWPIPSRYSGLVTARYIAA